MRVATLSRMELGKRHMRFDPAFYVRRAMVRSTINSEGSRHVRLNDLVDSIHDGARLPLTSSGVPMIRLNNVRPCELNLSHVAHADGTAAKWINACEGDVLFTRAAQPFRAAVVPSGVPTELAVSSELTIIRPRPAVLPEYLAAVFCTPTLNSILGDLSYRGRSSALPRLRLADIKRLPVPLPPRSLQESLARHYRQAVELTASARAEINAVALAIHNEIDHRVLHAGSPGDTIVLQRSVLSDRLDVPFNRGRMTRDSLASSPMMRPLRSLAKPGVASLRGLDDDEEVFAVQADDVNEETFLVEGGMNRPLSELSLRMRQRLAVGDVLLCTTGAGDQTAYLDDNLESGGLPIVGSATLTPLRFNETPRVFTVTLAHPLVRRQLCLLSSGSVQRFVTKRDLDELLIPVLGQVWREDFETRLKRAMQRRREALRRRTSLIHAADDFLQEAMQ